MLEVVHLTKIYKAKGGVETKALNDVSVRFPEKGMVFLLGKSGSGKSTLLNVCGGLDAPTSGEVIVKGRSSKNFSQSDFDSYRNTFIGFVFQEYNILNEFTVEDNIALALELQGKPKDKAAIRQLLDDVDLGAYAHRKPNTLSGGQKQRIAIARALIKQPQIIMADEPTGALDSNTGKQVFDTLKKLSLKKLVIVVSHDRDFAEEYADRIIELKDGKILSDVTKAAAQPQSLGDNISVIGDNTLSVKNGSALTERDYQYIRSFLSHHENAMLTSGEKEISDFKKVSHITEEGGKEYFENTDEKKIPKKEYDPKKTRFIRSKLPLRHAFRIGVSGLKSKPIRLIFTILLCSVAFIMFGLFSTLMLYDKDETLYQTFNDSGVAVLRADKRYKITTSGDDYSYDTVYHTRMTDDELKKIADRFGSETVGVTALYQPSNGSLYNGYNISSAKIFDADPSSASLGEYYAAELRYAGYLPENHPLRNKITGTYPVNNDEVLISSYTASVLTALGYEKSATESALIGKTISFYTALSGGSASPYKITGIFDSGDKLLAQKYEKYKKEIERKGSQEEIRKMLEDIENLQAELQDGMYEAVFFNESVASSIASATKEQKANPFGQKLSWQYRLSFGIDSSEYYDSVYYVSSDLLSEAGETVFSEGKTSVSAGEIVLSAQTFYSYLARCYDTSNEFASNLDNELNGQGDIYSWLKGENIPSSGDANYEAYLQYLGKTGEGGQYHDQAAIYKIVCDLFENSFTIDSLGDEPHSFAEWMQIALLQMPYNSDKVTQTQAKTIWTEILKRYNAVAANLPAVSAKVLANGNDSAVGKATRFFVAGVNLYSDSTVAFLSSSDYETLKAVSDSYNEYTEYKTNQSTKYTEDPNAKYDIVFAPYSSAHRNDLSLFTYEYSSDDSRIALGNNVGQALELVNVMIDETSQVFLWIGVVMAAFSMLLLSSFIAISISYKKKEIGILRAVGARGADVFKIFFSEAFVIALICFVLGVAGSIAGCKILNDEVSSAIHASLFVFGGASIAILLGIAIVTSAVATFFPVFSAARKKPVESIRAL